MHIFEAVKFFSNQSIQFFHWKNISVRLIFLVTVAMINEERLFPVSTAIIVSEAIFFIKTM